MNVLVAVGDPGLQRKVAEGLSRTGFGVVEVRQPGLISSLPDDDLVAPCVLHAAVVGYGFGFDGLAFGTFLRGRLPCLGVVYIVGDPWMADRTRALDYRCERTVLIPLPGRHLSLILLARVLGEVSGWAHGACPRRVEQRRTDP